MTLASGSPRPGAVAMDVLSPGETGPGKVCADVARLFIALWPGPDLAQSIRARCGDRTAIPDSKAVATDRIHLTINFLGNVQRHRMPELVQALDVPFHPFELSFSHCEHWRHGLVVAIPDATPLPMIHLHAQLGDALRRVGLHIEDHAFRPHLTLARRHFQPLPQPTGAPLRWLVDGYVLVESRATPRREYQVVHRYG